MSQLTKSPLRQKGTSFEEAVRQVEQSSLQALSLETLQVNITLRCNLQCRHCHVASSPLRREVMDEETMDHVLSATRVLRPKFVDITGGAPEIHPRFRQFVQSLTAIPVQVKVRTNLTILLEPGFEDLPQFFREHRIHCIASLPCYLEERVDQQRGRGVYEKSIAALKKLNEVGYGCTEDLPLDLVYNPVGATLPPPQEALEEEYKRELKQRFGIVFTHLYTITNMPIGMFRHDLREAGELTAYEALLQENFNGATLPGLMCRRQIHVGWDGTLYDCDFNYALHLPVDSSLPRNIADFTPERFLHRNIVTGSHCFGCTAGAGSSCGGKLV